MKRLVKISLIFIGLILYTGITDKFSVVETEPDRMVYCSDRLSDPTSGLNKQDSPYQPLAELGGIAFYVSYSSVLRLQKINLVNYLSSVRNSIHLLADFDTTLSRQLFREAADVAHVYSSPVDYFIISLRRLLI